MHVRLEIKCLTARERLAAVDLSQRDRTGEKDRKVNWKHITNFYAIASDHPLLRAFTIYGTE